MSLYELLEEDGWADHYNCPLEDGECGKRVAERESAERIELVLREKIAGELRKKFDYPHIGFGSFIELDKVVEFVTRGVK